MATPTVKVFTNDGGEHRELTENEYADYNKLTDEDAAQRAATKTAATAQAAAKKSAEKKLAALGLTADEIAAL